MATNAYFAANPDVAAAYESRFTDPNLASTVDMTPDQFAQTHYERHGQFEQRAAPASATSGSAGSGLVASQMPAAPAGYSGEAGANRGEAADPSRLSGYNSVTTRALVENSLGRVIDNEFYNPANPQYQENMRALERANMAMYGNIGANLDWRDWNSIMASSNPLQAAEDSLRAMYNDPAYLRANADYVLQQGYLPEQADYTYQQMADRVGSTYNPGWAAGSRFEGQFQTQEYLNNIRNLAGDQLASYENNLWSRWGGNPRASRASVVDTGTGQPGNTTNVGGTEQGTGATGEAALPVYGPDGTRYASATAARAAGVFNFTYAPPASTSAAPGTSSGNASFTQPAQVPSQPATTGGLIANANNPVGSLAPASTVPGLTPGVQNGLIGNPFAPGGVRVRRPAGVTNPFSV